MSIDWTNADEVIAEAVWVTSSERGIDYDAPEDNFARIAAVWNMLLDEKLEFGYITEGDVARMMIAVKLVRDAHTPKRDNRVDLVGYTRCLERVEPTNQPVGYGRITAEQAAEADAIYREMKPVEKSCATCNNWCGDDDKLTIDCLGESMPYLYRLWTPRGVIRSCETCGRDNYDGDGTCVSVAIETNMTCADNNRALCHWRPRGYRDASC